MTSLVGSPQPSRPWGRTGYAEVRSIRPGSIAAALGLEPGDRLIEVAGGPVRDYIDYRYLTAESWLKFRIVRRTGQEVIFEVEKDQDEDLGLEFTRDIFRGGIRTCANHCLFCFVDRLPAGLRPALYVKDDDYRLSFLHGNFITLTNLTRADVDRITALRLSPLYVSVHATEPELRAAMLGLPGAADILEQLADLTGRGLTLHTQVVVCPGWNDGPHLERTLADLSALGPGLGSVGVVPVGLTTFAPVGLPVRPLSAEERASVLDIALAWHRRLGGVVYPADELFLSLGRAVPRAAFYRGFPQLQNGIGLARTFLDDLARLRRAAGADGARPAAADGAPARVRRETGPFLVVTGPLARPLVEQAVATLSRISGRAGETLEVVNGFFGGEVTVAGLLTGADLIRAVSEHGGRGPVLVPGAALRAGADEFLDGRTLAEASRETGRIFVAAGALPSHMLATLAALAASGS